MEIVISLVTNLISIAVGALVTWKVADWYYKRASKDLVKEAGDLRSLNTTILRAFENAGFAELNRDENGNIVGLVLKLSGKIRAVSKTSDAELTIK
ncbi:MAG: hypothetical protein ACFFBD_03455 [Candidatus Hodarchaeota archaeon]